ncbi:MAG: fibronectin type III domain-containing protein, partial [bacterium]|nr:fibronectin type III domain-containing protein [bacterium]
MKRIFPRIIIALSAVTLVAVAPFVVHGQLALIVANIRVSALDTTATVSWSTNIPSTGRVEYGLTSAHGSTVGYDGEQRSSHQITLNGLKGETTYHFRVISTTSGQETASFDQTFKTIKAVDRDAPGLTDVAIPYQGGTEALIQWRT